MDVKARERSEQQAARETHELWELVRLAEEDGLVREPMELRRLFAEGEYRLEVGSLRKLASIARAARLPAATAWCEREIQRADTTPAFIRRIRTLFEPKLLDVNPGEKQRMGGEEDGVPVTGDEQPPSRGR